MSLLNVGVHEALGYVWCQEPLNSEGRAVNAGHPYMCGPDAFEFESRNKIARPKDWEEHYEGPDYENDWCVTGPLIEQHRITLTACLTGLANAYMASTSGAYVEIGPTALVAVCKLLVSLHAKEAHAKAR